MKLFGRIKQHHFLLKQHGGGGAVIIKSSNVNVETCIFFYWMVRQTVVSDTGCILSGIQAEDKGRSETQMGGTFLSRRTQKGESHFKIIQSHLSLNNRG